MTEIEIQRMWHGGPLRHVSATQRGSYVCERCMVPVVGVYRILGNGWICAACKGLGSPKSQRCVKEGVQVARTAIVGTPISGREIL
jgi:ribosomal protein L37AE/L43A